MVSSESKSWTTEAEMVADFSEWARGQGWSVYAETAGWDALLVRPADGFQVGVEAKLALNATVLCQAISRESSWARGVGPDSIAILAPARKTTNGLGTIARHLGFVVVEGSSRMRTRRVGGGYEEVSVAHFEPALPEIKAWDRSELGYAGWPERCPDKRHDLPEYVPDVTGGHPSPAQLTPWKIKAIKAAILLETRGFLTRADFKALGLDPSRWTQYWLKSIGDKRWVAKPNLPDFRAQHPTNYEQIKADLAKWSAPLPPAQPVLAAGAAS